MPISRGRRRFRQLLGFSCREINRSKIKRYREEGEEQEDGRRGNFDTFESATELNLAPLSANQFKI